MIKKRLALLVNSQKIELSILNLYCPLKIKQYDLHSNGTSWQSKRTADSVGGEMLMVFTFRCLGFLTNQN